MSAKKREVASDSPEEFQIRTIPPGFVASVRGRPQRGLVARSAERVSRELGALVRGGLQYGLGIALIYVAVCVPGLVQERLNGKPASNLVASPASAKLAEPAPSSLSSEAKANSSPVTPAPSVAAALPLRVAPPAPSAAASRKSRPAKNMKSAPAKVDESEGPRQWVQWR